MSHKRRPSPIPALVCALLLLFAAGFFGSIWLDRWSGDDEQRAELSAMEDLHGRLETTAEDELLAETARLGRAVSEEWRERLQRRLEHPRGRVKEAVAIFADDEAYRRFLARARAAGFVVLDESAALRAVRVRYDTIAAVQEDIFAHVRDYEEIGANTYVDRPKRPDSAWIEAGALAPVGDALLDVLGVSTDRSTWGRGVTIAVLDSGVIQDATFGAGRLRSLDIGRGIAPGNGDDEGHGTAVASIAAGASPDAPGVAPAASILSIRVTSEDGHSDVFTVSKAIVAAVDQGARVINISLGSYDTSVLLTRAIDYAEAAGAVIVAASGNDQVARLVWPAADPRVVSVGATDASGRLARFSNSGEGLKLAAPGVAVQAAWLDGQRVLFTGTSASAPVVAGALAAAMSQRPGESARDVLAHLQARADDAGSPGVDTEYGAGVLNLGWAMNTNPSRVDLAVASHWWPREGEEPAQTVRIVVQNRGAFAVAGATLETNAEGVAGRHVLPTLAAGESAVIEVPADAQRARREEGWGLRSRIVLPGGLTDHDARNNERRSVWFFPAEK